MTHWGVFNEKVVNKGIYFIIPYIGLFYFIWIMKNIFLKKSWDDWISSISIDVGMVPVILMTQNVWSCFWEPDSGV